VREHADNHEDITHNCHYDDGAENNGERMKALKELK
jgi:coenzyme F420-reducing hydrogenase delta subunit